jgi:arylsulfatase
MFDMNQNQFGKNRCVESRPDILFIMPDQMRGDCLSVLGHKGVKTPVFDGLAENGVLFTRAYSTCPSCIPARYGFLTGQFPTTSGVVGYEQKVLTDPTIPSILSEAGYYTAIAGRYMHQIPENNGYEFEVRGSTYEDHDEYDEFFRKNQPGSGGILNYVMNILGIDYNEASATPWPLDESLHPTVWTARQSLQVVEHAPMDRPLFLTASFYAPHPPLMAPRRYVDECRLRELPEPSIGQWVNLEQLSTEGNEDGTRILLEGELLSDVLSGYFGSIDQLDSEVAEIVHTFRKRSERAGRPWVILLSSDHGEMLGDHGYFRKCEPYDGSARIPFIISASEELGFQTGVKSNLPVCLEDMMPTLLGLAGASVPEKSDGIDLAPFLRGEISEIRDLLHSEHAPCYNEKQAYHAITDGVYKYIWRPATGQEQLFHLATDHGELIDLTVLSESTELLAVWRQKMVKTLVGRPEGFTDGVKLIAGRDYSPLWSS